MYLAKVMDFSKFKNSQNDLLGCSSVKKQTNMDELILGGHFNEGPLWTICACAW